MPASTNSDRAFDHYTALLEACGTPVAPVVIPLHVTDVDGLEVCNGEIGDRYEVFELGPFDGNRYIRFRSDDAVLLADVIRRRMDDATVATFDERDVKARAAMVECPGCRTRIAPDETSCLSPRCERIAAQESAL